MKTMYIQPNTTFAPISGLNSICVGSVHGNSGMRYGGGTDGSNPDISPM